MKSWQVLSHLPTGAPSDTRVLIELLLRNRGIQGEKEQALFLAPPKPSDLTPEDVGINQKHLALVIDRIAKAVKRQDSIVVYADYDADGITAGAILWETLYRMGARVMPYIPDRAEEGYGLSAKGIDAVSEQYHPALIITVDHGITAREKVAYARGKGIDVIVTDHHVKPDELPDCPIIHTTSLSGAGVSWFIANQLQNALGGDPDAPHDLLSLAAVGTIADMVPLTGVNRSVAKYGLEAINRTGRVGLLALMELSGLRKGEIGTYDVSHVLAPRLNAMGRIVHAMDALRLLCTKNEAKAMELAAKLNATNKERQQLTVDTVIHARDLLLGSVQNISDSKFLFVSHESYNQGVIGLVAGKLVEEYYRPAVVIARGEIVSKASARSIPGFNIVESIRSCADILIDVGGHPMAAGFTIETKYLEELGRRLTEIANAQLTEEMLQRTLKVDTELPLSAISFDTWQSMRAFEPFGFGNPEPVFATRQTLVDDVRLVGNGNKHLKLTVYQRNAPVVDAIGFGMGDVFGRLTKDQPVDIAYSVDMNTWNGRKKLQLKLKDIRFPQ